MGNVAAQLLLDLIQDPDEAQQSIVLPTELVIRESTARLVGELENG
jgi:DNA-binding LacI/PurR family transcriptional regulator